MTPALIFRYELLGLSETFIKAQAGALQTFQPCYAGIQRAAKSLPIPEDSILVMRDGSIAERVRRRLFLHTGWEPRFHRELHARAPALIHAHFAPDGAVALPLISEFSIPLIVSLHGYDVTSSEAFLSKSFFGRLYLKRKRKLLDAATLFLCASEFIRQSAIEAGFPPSKLRVHYIGVDRTLFVPSPRDRQPNLVLFVGRLIEQKGCRYLIEAMRLVQRKRQDAKLIIIGDGAARPAFEALAQNTGISCQFLGTQPSDVVRGWLARAQVFCGPSNTGANGAREGLGMVFAEAHAMGVPVVSFKHGGIPEVVRDGETGLLAPERDHQLLAEHLLRYLTDESFRQACSSRAIEWIEQQFDLRRQTRDLENLYRQVTGTLVRGHAGGGYN